jgi:cell shape-determining protein MreC
MHENDLKSINKTYKETLAKYQELENKRKTVIKEIKEFAKNLVVS